MSTVDEHMKKFGEQIVDERERTIWLSGWSPKIQFRSRNWVKDIMFRENVFGKLRRA